jgi:RNA polymerase primary sigma factor
MLKVGTEHVDEPAGPDVDGWTVYLREIGCVPRLTPEDEQELGRRIAAGDGDAVQSLVEANLRLVVAVAKRFRREGVALADLVQEGNIGLLQAAQRFDYRTGYRFSTYAVDWIRQAISRAVAAQAQVISIPVYVQQELGQMARAQADLQDAPPEAAAPPSSTSHVERLEMARRARQTASLDQSLGDDEETLRGEIVADTTTPSPFDQTATSLLYQRLHELLAVLPERERLILGLRYGLVDGRTHTCAEVAQRLRLTAERIRRLEAQALAQLRYGAGRQELGAYLAASFERQNDDSRRAEIAVDRAAS